MYCDGIMNEGLSLFINQALQINIGRGASNNTKSNGRGIGQTAYLHSYRKM